MDASTTRSRVLRNLYHSPTVNTWASFGAQTLSVVAILPFVLTRFSEAQIAVWYLFLTIQGVILLFDLGFVPTFIRVIAFALGGATDIGDFSDPGVRRSGEPNWRLVADLYGTLRTVFSKLTALACVVVGAVGTASLLRPIAALDDRPSAWAAWTIVLAATAVRFRGNVFVAYLEGLNQVALVRRWDAITSLGALGTAVAVFLSGGGLLPVVAAVQAWQVIRVGRNYWLCRSVAQGRFEEIRREGRYRPELFREIWPRAWRSGVGILMSIGMVRLSGMLYAQIAEPARVASYLLALQFAQAITQFGQAPFYSKIPALARLRSEGDLPRQIRKAQTGMRLAHWTFSLGVVATGSLARPFLDLIGSNAEFVTPTFWALLGLAIFLERYGAMHIQLYSTTNHVIWHTANGVTGTLYLAISLGLLPLLDMLAFPIAMLVSYAAFYTWYAASHSLRSIRLRFWAFERGVSVVPFAIVAGYLIVTACREYLGVTL